MAPSFRFSLALLAFALPVLADAQVHRCADSAGKLQYSDKPCTASQTASEVRIYAAPAAPRLSTEAAAYERTRQQRRESSDESHQRIDVAVAQVQQLKTDNHDPRKCAAVRERMTRIEQRNPLLYKADPDYFDYQQKASLHCGN